MGRCTVCTKEREITGDVHPMEARHGLCLVFVINSVCRCDKASKSMLKRSFCDSIWKVPTHEKSSNQVMTSQISQQVVREQLPSRLRGVADLAAFGPCTIAPFRRFVCFVLVVRSGLMTLASSVAIPDHRFCHGCH